MMLMQDFRLVRSDRQPASYIERDLKAIYSNSNILFLRKDAEILFSLFFSGIGFTFYGLRSFHV